ncbi:MAG: TolC family protein, partial [Bacteroidota bacterium]
MLKQITLIALSLCFSQLSAQDNLWSLERSVNYAFENNLQVKQLKNQAAIAQLNLKGAKWSQLPSVTGNGSIGTQYGRTIDPTTNAFNQQNITFNSFQINANVTVFNGQRIRKNIRQSKLDVQAADLEASATANDIGLQVANSYLTVLLTREQLSNARAQLQLTEDQLAQTDAGIEAGSLPVAQRYDLVAQQAANQQSIVDLENQVKIALINLQLTLELDPSEDFDIITPDLDISQADLVERFQYEEVYLAATASQPGIRAAEVRRASADVGKEVAKADYYPTLTAFGSLSSNFSSAARTVNTDNASLQPGAPVPLLVNGVEVEVQAFEQTGVRFEDQPYFDQLNQNFGQTIGLRLDVPIYNQGRARLGVQQAEIQRLNADVSYQQAVNQLQSDVLNAIINWEGAKQSYEAA